MPKVCFEPEKMAIQLTQSSGHHWVYFVWVDRLQRIRLLVLCGVYEHTVS